MATKKIIFSGVVQGVGFRPFVYKMALKKSLKGYVKNLSDGSVEVIVDGSEEHIKYFIEEFDNPPPLSKIEEVEMEDVLTGDFKDFDFIKSGGRASFGVIPPDTAPCEKCLDEFQNKKDKRHAYPFISCTDCGPRYTIINKIPYDRENTSFHDFPLCSECEREYVDVENRRFDYKSISCHICGPRFSFFSKEGIKKEGLGFNEAGLIIKKGGIILLKGTGGMHLICDAENKKSIKKLRNIISRPQQPLAIMCKDIKNVNKNFRISNFEEITLKSKKSPIIILEGGGHLPENISPGLENLGVMLPYNPSHTILFEKSGKKNLIFTSANIHGHPIIIENADALKQFRNKVDGFLLHELKIASRCDDSVVKIINNKKTFLRKSRGYVLKPIKIGSKKHPTIIGLGGELNNTITIIKNSRIYISQYVGNTTKLLTQKYLKDTIRHMCDVTDTNKTEIVCSDMHPDYFTTELSRELSDNPIKVQHHHAHALSLMAEKKISEDIICITCDGTGYGLDGSIWGGEILKVGKWGFENLGGLKKTSMPGGDLASRYPIRALASFLYDQITNDEIISHLEDLCDKLPYGKTELQVIMDQIGKNINIHQSTSTGRILDALSGLLGICGKRTYEGEPAMKLESLASTGSRYLEIEKEVKNNRLNVSKVIKSCLDHYNAGAAKEDIAMSLHLALAETFADIAIEKAIESDIQSVGFSGGVAYNTIFSKIIQDKTKENNIRYIQHEKLPPGDGGISVGQAYKVFLECV